MRLRIALAAMIAAAGMTSGALAQDDDDDEPPLGPESMTLHDCVLDGATGEEREAIMQLAFVAMAQSTAVKPLWAVPPQTVDQVEGRAAGVIEHLLLDRCRKELVAALQVDGGAAAERAGEGLMQAAMGALYDESSDGVILRGLPDHFDEEKWNGLRSDFGLPPKAGK